MEWVRSAALRGVRSVIGRLGGDADAMACRAGVPVAALDDDELPVNGNAVLVLLESAARELRCPDFGLRVALEQDLSMLGPLAIALQNAPTAADALEYAAKYLFLHARGFSLTVVPDPRGSRNTIGVRYGYPDRVRESAQSIDMGLLFTHRALTYLFHGDYGLRSVEIPHAAAASRSRYEDLFGAQANFTQPEAILRVPSDLPRRTIGGGDQMSRQLALFFLDAQVEAADQPLARRVKVILQHSLGTGPTSVSTVADLLAMSPRSLQRHLANEGKSFSAVLDDARRERAAALLRHSDLSLAQVALTIGLNDAATLSRYARRWWGTTAGAFRGPSSRRAADDRRSQL